MTTTDVLFTVAAVGACAIGYFLYWLGWCWSWYYLWPTGPKWLTRPEWYNFLGVCFTGVIITLLILRDPR
jgi:hypothetical protein